MEPREKALAILELRNAKYRQADSVDPKQKENIKIKIDSKVAEIRDRSMSDEDWVKEMMKLGA